MSESPLACARSPHPSGRKENSLSVLKLQWVGTALSADWMRPSRWLSLYHEHTIVGEPSASPRQERSVGPLWMRTMDLPKESELAQTYRSASDQELLEISLTYDSLTDEAQRALRAEFERRGLEPPELPDPSPDLDFQKLITVRQYRDLTDAQLAKGVLDSAGILSYLRDENIVRTCHI